jgi:hypothetical protein
MIFGLWNVRSLHRAGFLMTVSRELSKYKLDLVGVRENTHFSMKRGMRVMNWVQVFFCA